MARNDGTDIASVNERAWAELRRSKAEWEELRMCDDVYYILRHVPCGTEVQVMGGYKSICPLCQPEEWAKELGNL
jgi:hypothetical protein